MSRNSKVLPRVFLDIGLILLIVSAVVFYYHFTFTKNAIRTGGVTVDAVWYDSHSNSVDSNGSWYPVVTFCPTPDCTLISNSNINNGFYEDSEGDRVNVYYPSGHPEQAKINNPWVNFFKRDFANTAGIIFGNVGLIITPPSTKKSCRKRKSRP